MTRRELKKARRKNRSVRHAQNDHKRAVKTFNATGSDDAWAWVKKTGKRLTRVNRAASLAQSA